MKKSVIIFFAMFCNLCIHAQQGKNVELTSPDSPPWGAEHRTDKPNVSYDGDEVTITCDSTIYNVDVVISDQYGNVMHQSANTVDPAGVVIYSHSNGDSEKTSIDLYYDDKHLKGYFE